MWLARTAILSSKVHVPRVGLHRPHKTPPVCPRMSLLGAISFEMAPPLRSQLRLPHLKIVRRTPVLYPKRGGPPKKIGGLHRISEDFVKETYIKFIPRNNHFYKDSFLEVFTAPEITFAFISVRVHFLITFHFYYFSY